MTVKARKVLPGLAITATGGFGVFVVCLLVLEPGMSKGDSGQCAPPAPALTRSQILLRDLAIETANLNTRYSELKAGPQQRDAVHKDALQLIERAGALSDSELTKLEAIVRLFYVSQLHSISTLTSDWKVIPGLKEGHASAVNLVKTTGSALGQIDDVAKDKTLTAAQQADIREYVSKYRSREGLRYMKGVGTVYLYLVAEQYKIGERIPLKSVADAFSDVSYSYLKDHNAHAEEIIQWFCRKVPKDPTLCQPV